MDARIERETLSKLHCTIPSALAPALVEALEGMGIPEAYVQRGKQLALEERRGLLAPLFGSNLGRTELAEDRAEIWRFHLPRELEAAAAWRVAEACDLFLPGRGSLFAEDVSLLRAAPADFSAARAALAAEAPLAGREPKDFTVLCCIVQRGLGDPLSRTILEMGLCVPAVSFGLGMGLRNRLGLLRITIPVEKEVMYFAVPSSDAPLVAGVAVRKARLDRPGQGFIYRYPVRAYAVNNLVRRGGRRHVATMEQVIEALDEMRGSTEWRRIAAAPGSKPRQPGQAGEPGKNLVCFSLVCDEGRATELVKAAMDSGAGGATLVQLGHRAPAREGQAPSRHARETCDLIVPEELVEPLEEVMAAGGLFGEGAYGLVEVTRVERALTFQG
ncbi:MAG: hypothetical protein JNG85_02690 [Spirochaetaceae bacterium]|nr:hypothetical protein [Spirochaetaceae bacterium]